MESYFPAKKTFRQFRNGIDTPDIPCYISYYEITENGKIKS